MANYTKYFDNCLAVFQGGGCKAIAYVGAYEAAYLHGVIFNELAGTSAGAIIAALIAAGATPDDLKNLVKELFIDKRTSFKKRTWLSWLPMLVITMITPILWIIYICKPQYARFIISIPLCALWRKHGMYPLDSLQEILEQKLQQLTHKSEVVCFNDLTTNLHIVSSDIEKNEEKIWDKKKTPKESIAHAVCASCAYPFYFQPVDNKFVDGGLLSNTPNHIFAQHATYNRILSFQLHSKQNAKGNFIGYIKRIVDTVVDGAVSLQETLGNQAYYDIPIDLQMELSAIDFDKISQASINRLIERGRVSTDAFFEEKDKQGKVPIYLGAKSNRTLDSLEKMYTLIASYSRDHIASEIYISTQDTVWVWPLFPTILRWRLHGTKVVVYVPRDLEKRKTTQVKEDARRKLLKALKCDLIREDEQNTILGFFSKDNEGKWSGVVYGEKEEPQEENNDLIMAFDKGYYYDGSLESRVIQSWVEKLRIKKEPDWDQKKLKSAPKIHSISIEPIIDILKRIDIYANAQITYQEINIKDVRFMSNFVRLEKYRQIDVLFDWYKENKLKLFEPAVITFQSKIESVITPVIIEQHNGILYVIEGKTRLKYANHHGIQTIKAFVVSNVGVNLPINESFVPPTVEHIMVTDDKSPENVNCMHLFRHIEESFHPSPTYLPEIKLDD